MPRKVLKEPRRKLSPRRRGADGNGAIEHPAKGDGRVKNEGFQKRLPSSIKSFTVIPCDLSRLLRGQATGKIPLDNVARMCYML